MEKDHRLRKLAQIRFAKLRLSAARRKDLHRNFRHADNRFFNRFDRRNDQTRRRSVLLLQRHAAQKCASLQCLGAANPRTRKTACPGIMEQMDAYVGIRCVDNPIDAAVRAWNKIRCFTGSTPSPFISTSAFRKPNGAFCVIRLRLWRFSRTCRPKSLKTFTFRPV